MFLLRLVIEGVLYSRLYSMQICMYNFRHRGLSPASIVKAFFLFSGHKIRPQYDFDYVALDLLAVYPEDSGTYTCTARNALGEATTSATVKISGKSRKEWYPGYPGITRII